MKKRIKYGLTSLLVLSMILQASFAGGAVLQSGLFSYANSEEKIDESLQAGIPGELIVTLNSEPQNKKRGITPGSERRNEVTKEVQAHVASMNAPGIEVRDSVIRGNGDGNFDKNLRFGESFEEKLIKEQGYIYLVEYDDTYGNWQEAAKAVENQLMEQNISVKHIEPNYEVTALSGNTIHSNQQWNYKMINLEEAWSITNGSKDVFVAVMDTGIDHNHESLKNLVAKNLGKNFSSSGGESDTMDRHGHGTHVAGIIASYNKVSGVARQTRLIPVKVMSDEGSGSQFGIIKGIYYAVDQGADVINMSIGSTNSNTSYEAATDFATENGVIVVGAAGNSGQNQLLYPAGYDSVIAVGSVDRYENRSSFSNYGKGLDLMAPGSTVYSTTPGNTYARYSGTSMAAPHISGVVALMKAVKPEITTDEVRSVLKNTARKTQNHSTSEYGSGVVNAFRAVEETAEKSGGSDSTEPTADDLYEEALSQRFLSETFWAFTAAYRIHPDDPRFVTGVKESTIGLLRWTQRRHSEGSFDTALIRYDRILAEEDILPKYLVDTTKASRKKAEAKELILNPDDAREESHLRFLTPRFRAFTENYELYKWNDDFVEGMIQSGESLMNWTVNRHNEGDFETAIERYDRILRRNHIPELKSLIDRAANYKASAEAGRFTSADHYVEYAKNQRFLSETFWAYTEGYRAYPNDSRLIDGVEQSTIGLLRWTQRRHSEGNIETAIIRYDRILAEKDILPKYLVDAVMAGKAKAEAGEIIFSPDHAREESHLRLLTPRFRAFTENYVLYSWNDDFVEGMVDSGESLMTWAVNRHNEGNFDAAIERYDRIISRNHIPQLQKLVERAKEYNTIAKTSTTLN